MTDKPEQLEMFPGAESDEPEEAQAEQPVAPDLSLTADEMVLLFSLAATGRDLIRRHQIMGNIPDDQLATIRSTLSRADALLDKIGNEHGSGKYTQ